MSPDFKGLTGGDRLYRIRLNLGCGYFLKDSWLLTGAFWPEIDSDLDGTLWHKDHQQFGQILSTHQVSDSFFLKYGVAFTQEIDNRYIHAVLGCAWVPDDRWRVDVLLPTLAQVAFTPRPGTTILGGVELEGAQYQWRDPGTKHRHDQQIQEVRAYIGTETKVTDALSLLLRAGITFVGEYELRYSWRTVDGDLKPTPYFQVGLGFDL